MDERKADILRAVVEEYVATGAPVGSQTIARSASINVSSATVRNDMNVLEREGYIVQPHTSAGRIPTDRGYRFFVDHFGENGALAPRQRRAVVDFFATAHRALEELLQETSQLLPGITAHTAMVLGPPSDSAVVRNVQLVPLGPRDVLSVAVLSNGSVEKDRIVLEADTDDESIARASRVLSAATIGRAPGDAYRPEGTGDASADSLAGAARARLVTRGVPGGELLFVGGTNHIAEEQAAETAARLLEVLERQVVVVSLVRELLDQGVTVSIGAENELHELRQCSLVLAPYEVDGQLAGTVGLIGPTRMDYRHALSAVAAVSDQLGRLLS